MTTIQELKDEIENLKEQKELLENNENEDDFDNYLDDCNQEVKIGNLTYSPSHVLKNIDEIAYNEAFSEYNDSALTDIEEQLEEKEAELKEAEERINIADN